MSTSTTTTTTYTLLSVTGNIPIKIIEKDPTFYWTGIRDDNKKIVRFPAESVKMQITKETHPEYFL